MEKITLIFILFISACDNGEDKRIVNEMSAVSVSENIDKKEDIQNDDKFTLAPLDSIVADMIGCKLVETQVNQMDSVKEYRGLWDAFKTNGLQSISYKHCKSNTSAINKNLIPGRIVQLKFSNENDAKNSFSIFSEDLLKGSIKGKIALKSGGICFVENNTIYLVPISTCGDNKGIDLIEQTIKEQVFHNTTFEGIKMYCSLSHSELIE